MSVRVEYAPEEYDTIDKMESLMISTPRGTQVPLSDIGEIYYADSPLTIERRDKQYEVAITCEAVEGYEETAEASVKKFAAEYQFPAGVSNAANAMDEMMAEELGALAGAIGTAVFLIFVVMAMQFESPKFSLMVMFSIPFSLIGAFGLLYLAKCKISMVDVYKRQVHEGHMSSVTLLNDLLDCCIQIIFCLKVVICIVIFIGSYDIFCAGNFNTAAVFSCIKLNQH